MKNVSSEKRARRKSAVFDRGRIFELYGRTGGRGLFFRRRSAYEIPHISVCIGAKTQKVGQKNPNAWGLYDCHGNVWEWCLDWYSDLTTAAVTDPVGASSGSQRIIRGGDWADEAWLCRSARRSYIAPTSRDFSNVGFRLVCPFQ